MRRLLAVAAVLGVFLLGFAPTASASTTGACQGQVGCDSGWIAHNCPEPNGSDNVNIRVIWRGTGYRDVYWSGSYVVGNYAPTPMSVVRIWASIPPDGQWVLKGEDDNPPPVGAYREFTFSVLSPDLPHNWQIREEDGRGYWCNTPQVLN